MLKLIFISLFVLTLAIPQFRKEKITTARPMERPIDNPFLKRFGVTHQGVEVTTSGGNKYLIHNTPNSGITATDTKMSSKWKPLEEPTNVKHDHTIGDVIKGCHGYGNGLSSYITGKTCVGTKRCVMDKLEE
jgi:hypothetical protein